jgi:hypothetical protein
LKKERRKHKSMRSISGKYETPVLDWFGSFRE